MPARTGCCQYSVRSYVAAGEPDEGETNWTADYWKDSTGAFTASAVGGINQPPNDVLHVAVDAAGDVYVGGPRLTSSANASVHWNVIKFDGASGQVVWKVDITLGGLRNNVFGICYNVAEDRIWVMGDSNSNGGGGTTGVSKLEPADGSVTGSQSGGTHSGLIRNGTSVMFTPNQSIVPGPTAFPYYQSVANGKLATFGRRDPSFNVGVLAIDTIPSTAPNDFGYILYAGSPPSVGGAPIGVDMFHGGVDLLVALSANTIGFSDGSSTKLLLLDTGLDAPWGATSPANYRWINNYSTRPVIRFQDATYLWVAGTLAPRTTECVLVSDGSKVFAHTHLIVTGIDMGTDTVVTCGTRKPKSTDVDFT